MTLLQSAAQAEYGSLAKSNDMEEEEFRLDPLLKLEHGEGMEITELVSKSYCPIIMSQSCVHGKY